MGVDTGLELHVVISRRRMDGEKGQQIIFCAIITEYSQLDELIQRLNISICVIEALAEIHITRRVAARARHRGARVYAPRAFLDLCTG